MILCGIATIAIGRRARRRTPYPLLKRLAKELLVELSPRGMDAAGIAVVNESEKKGSYVFKKPLRPARLAARPKFQEVLDGIDQDTNFILLHARATTVGSTDDNFNNHPIITPPILGIHNGTLFNEEELFKKFDLEREGTVDSEVILRLFGYFLDQGLSPKQALQETSKELFGAFTGAMIDMEHRHRMMMFRFERPLCLFHFPTYDMILTVSEPRFYDNAARRLKIKAKDNYRYIKDGTGMLLDLNIPGNIKDQLVTFELPIEQQISKFRRYAPWLQGEMW